MPRSHVPCNSYVPTAAAGAVRHEGQSHIRMGQVASVQPPPCQARAASFLPCQVGPQQAPQPALQPRGVAACSTPARNRSRQEEGNTACQLLSGAEVQCGTAAGTPRPFQQAGTAPHADLRAALQPAAVKWPAPAPAPAAPAPAAAAPQLVLEPRLQPGSEVTPPSMAASVLLQQEVAATAPASMSTEAEVEICTVVRQLCPDCKQAFDTLDAVRAHWLEVHSPASARGGKVDPAPKAEEPVLVATAFTAATASCQAAEQSQPATEEVSRRVHVCPDCGEAFPTLEEARAHWLQTHRPAQLDPSPCVPSGTEGEEERPEEADREEEAEREEETERAASSALPQVALSRAQLIEADQEGRPVVVRHVDEGTGAARTVVMNEDGSMRMFGADTVSSMTARDEGDLTEWMAEMTDRHLRGLVHEVRERLVESSQLLHSRRAEVERLSRRLNFQFFALPEGAREKDLDNAYRRLARSMHPDKNGGTETAKENFQKMKGRYEELKAQLNTASEPAPAQPPQPAAPSQDKNDADKNEETAGDETTCEEPKGEAKPSKTADTPVGQEDEAEADREPHGEEQGPSGQTEQENSTPRRKEAYDEDGEASQPEATSDRSSAPTRAHDSQPDSREKLEASAWKMLRQIKMINQNLKIVESDYRRVQSEADAEELDRD